MTYKGDIEYDNFRKMVFTMTNKGLFDMMEDIYSELKKRTNMPKDIYGNEMYIDGQKNPKCLIWESKPEVIEKYLETYHPEYVL